MKLVIENIGAITSASVDIGNLTVIAGENDVGKSTIGRVFFAIVHAYVNYPVLSQKDRVSQVWQVYDQAYLMVRRVIDLTEYRNFQKRPSWLLGLTSDTQVEEIGRIRTEFSNLAAVVGNNQDVFARVDRMFEGLIDEIRATDLIDKGIGKSILKTLLSEFSGQVIRADAMAPARIKLIDGATTILDMAFDEQGICSFSGVETLGINDTSLIEGAAIFQLASTLRNIEILDDKNYSLRSIPIHSIDLVNKLRNSNWHDLKTEVCIPYVTGELHGGEMSFDDESQEFFLLQRGKKILAHNAASGIKALTILDLLIEGNGVRDDTLLILDEPETNLHPKWQIEYAKIICKLASEGKKFLVTTHSPYMLEALKGYSSKVAESRFYLAHRDEDQVIRFTDTLGDITPIIDTLSRPLADMLDDLGHDF